MGKKEKKKKKLSRPLSLISKILCFLQNVWGPGANVWKAAAQCTRKLFIATALGNVFMGWGLNKLKSFLIEGTTNLFQRGISPGCG